MAKVPHALSTAYDALCEPLQPIVNYEKTLQNLPLDAPIPTPPASPMPKDILDQVDSFVHALSLVPGAEDELRGRAEFIAGQTGPGSVFANERGIVLGHMSRAPKEEFSRWEREYQEPPKRAKIKERHGRQYAYWREKKTDEETGETIDVRRAERLETDGTFLVSETCVWEHDAKIWQGGCQWQKDCQWQGPCLWRGDRLRDPILVLDDLEVPTLNLYCIRNSAFCEVLNQLEPGVVEHINRWYAECVRIKTEAKILQADGCRQLFLLHQGGLPDAPADARYVRGMAEVPAFSDNWVEEMLLAAGSLVEWAENMLPGQPNVPPGTEPPKRSWTKRELDKEISKYKGDREKLYDGFKKRWKEGDTSVVREARKLFGRNVLAKRFQAPPAMVSGSTVWTKIRDELGLGREATGHRQVPGKRTGLEIAVEKASQKAGDLVSQAVQEKEALVRIIKEKTPSAIADDLIWHLESGERSIEDTELMLAAHREQEDEREKDRRAEKVAKKKRR